MTVTEPGNQVTSYAYFATNQLRQVNQGSQVRSFWWTGSDLQQATNPGNGTVSYTYYGAGLVRSKLQNSGKITYYNYDAYGRVTDTHPYPNGTSEDLSQRVHYSYDQTTVGSAGWLQTDHGL